MLQISEVYFDSQIHLFSLAVDAYLNVAKEQFGFNVEQVSLVFPCDCHRRAQLDSWSNGQMWGVHVYSELVAKDGCNLNHVSAGITLVPNVRTLWCPGWKFSLREWDFQGEIPSFTTPPTVGLW